MNFRFHHQTLDLKNILNICSTNSIASTPLTIILYCFFSKAGCAYFAYQRYKQGVDVAFASTYESDPTANAYSSYPIGNDTDQYNEPPFSNTGQQQQRGNIKCMK